MVTPTGTAPRGAEPPRAPQAAVCPCYLPAVVEALVPIAGTESLLVAAG